MRPSCFVALWFLQLTNSLSEQAHGHAAESPWFHGLENIVILHPESQDNQKVVDDIFVKQENAHFDRQRYAILLMPGAYKTPLRIHVGYYTQILGVGRTPADVQLNQVFATNGANGHATNNFWRAMEGVTLWDEDTTWAVSQASPIRRSVVNGNLHLSKDEKYSSGGFMSDVSIHGKLFMGTQQQWMFRNVDAYGGIECPAGWNYVFVGMRGLDYQAQQGCSGITPDKVVSIPPGFSAEKPFLVWDKEWQIHVPSFSVVAGSGQSVIGLKIPFKDVFVTRPGMNADEINKGIRDKRALLVTPYVYELSKPITIKKDGFVVLGIGMATLVATHGEPAVEVVDNVTEVRIAGLILEAGTLMRDERTDSLLRWGERTKREFALAGPASGIVSDVFTRIGSFKYRDCPVVRADTMVEINSDNVVLDHLWLWHADHDDCGTDLPNKGPSDKCFSKHGIVVNGHRITAYGLASEHTPQGHMLVWNGEEGNVHFYQSEIPYHQTDWGAKGYAGYVVAPHVKKHLAHGVGVYIIAFELKESIRSAFILPKYAQVYNMFNVTIGPKVLFRNLACVDDTDTCYQPEKCSPMRCYRAAFPFEKLPPAVVQELKEQKLKAKQRAKDESAEDDSKKRKETKEIIRNEVGSFLPPRQEEDNRSPLGRAVPLCIGLLIVGAVATSVTTIAWRLRTRYAGSQALGLSEELSQLAPRASPAVPQLEGDEH